LRLTRFDGRRRTDEAPRLPRLLAPRGGPARLALLAVHGPAHPPRFAVDGPARLVAWRGLPRIIIGWPRIEEVRERKALGLRRPLPCQNQAKNRKGYSHPRSQTHEPVLFPMRLSI
jgi:hypothetical protein